MTCALFPGNLSAVFGALPVMAVGVALNAVCIAVALVALLLGVGWNFLFVSSALFTTPGWAGSTEVDRPQFALTAAAPTWCTAWRHAAPKAAPV